jgi:hypothetical protein
MDGGREEGDISPSEEGRIAEKVIEEVHIFPKWKRERKMEEKGRRYFRLRCSLCIPFSINFQNQRARKAPVNSSHNDTRY